MGEKDIPKGYTCECGKFHKYPMYVYAHWRDVLVHACDCGRKYNIVCGSAELDESTRPKPKRKRKAKKCSG